MLAGRKLPMSHIAFSPRQRAPALPHTLSFLAEIGVPIADAAACLARAKATGRPLDEIVIGAGLISEEAFYRGLARRIGAPFLRSFATDPALPVPALNIGAAPLAPGSGARFALAPRGEALDRLLERARPGGLMPGAGVTTPSRLASSLRADIEARMAHEAANALPEASPLLSVRDGCTRRERYCLGSLAAGLLAAVAASPQLTISVLLLLCGALFLFGAALRLAACRKARGSDLPCPPLSDVALPRYTILAPLHREGRVLGQLVQALSLLDYPPEKLDIKLLVEADDAETLSAAGRLAMPPQFAVVICPPGLPRTKPRALNIGLRSATGALLVVYDAEDLPDRDQLRLAAARFAAAPRELACLQARLAPHNHAACRLAHLFALEYAALFRVIIPGFARLGVPIPLGGTSNHFRVDVLRRVLAWDAWNVAEDADLGLRLARLGWTVGALASTTREEAVITGRAWMAQRSRWLKGWMQSSLVHGRAVFRQERASPFEKLMIVSHTVGLVLAAMGFPFFLATLCWKLCDGSLLNPSGAVDGAAAIVSVLVFAVGVVALVLPLGLGARGAQLRFGAGDLALFCFYLFMMCAAAWRAAWELARNPQGWNKTEHGLSPPARSSERRVLIPRPLKNTAERPWPNRRARVAG
ncbi:hypothetical protein GCM10007036_06650 [Alsobacter metallidurans]|uniref:Glycosyltransferase 2-like domain-containing protein n=2 Tax=Alsobacter metallidurans TaxID=340221 RepID=A0A917MGC2_9HYPH|nr:hypothetical protein GCM10007036_06650 [Alsobacter metallidurans]